MTTTTYTLTAEQIERVNLWLRLYGPQCKDADFGYDDIQMTDDCVYDLGYQDQNNHVYDLVKEYIRTH